MIFNDYNLFLYFIFKKLNLTTSIKKDLNYLSNNNKNKNNFININNFFILKKKTYNFLNLKNNLLFFNIKKYNFFVLLINFFFKYKYFLINYNYNNIYKTRLFFNSIKNSKLKYSYSSEKSSFFNFVKLNYIPKNNIKYVDGFDINENLINKKSVQKDNLFISDNVFFKDIKKFNLKKKILNSFFNNNLYNNLLKVSFFVYNDYNFFDYYTILYSKKPIFNFIYNNYFIFLKNFNKINFLKLRSPNFLKILIKKNLKKKINYSNNFSNFYYFNKFCKNFFLKKIKNYEYFNEIYLNLLLKNNFIKFNFTKSLNDNTLYNYSLFLKKVFKNIIYLNDNYYLNLTKSRLDLQSFSIFSNKFFLKNIPILHDTFLKRKHFLEISKFDSLYNNKNKFYYNNYYPIYCLNKLGFDKYQNKTIIATMNNFYSYFQNLLICFFENFFKKKISLTITNNYFRKTYNRDILSTLINDNKSFKPFFMKNYSIIDFIEIFWYSLFLKDLTILSTWVTRFMESIHLRYHKKFLSFFNNFVKKYGLVFINYLNVKGFFFDIRGKVGVAGNSKKRHHFFKVGTLRKSTKKSKINFNQNLVRTPAGVLGLTYILNY